MVVSLEILFPLALLIGSVIGIRYAWTLVKKKNDFLQRATVTNARVIKTREIYHDDNGEGYYRSPILQFLDHRGQFVTIETSQQFDVWKLDEEVTIVFDKNSPHDAQIVSYWSLYAMPIIVGAISGFILVNSAGFLLSHLL
jgi:hypothetical protein